VLTNIIIREIQKLILSLRLHLILILLLAVFALGTVAYVKSHAADKQRYEQYYTGLLEEQREQAKSNLSEFVTQTRSLILAPRENAFISDAREKYFPTRFWYSGYNVFGYDVPGGASNDYMKTFSELNWAFIVSIIISFAVLLFTYDSVSGEKGARTLAITLSNPVSRGTLLFGKYLSAVIVVLLVLAPGVALSLLILLLSGAVTVSGALLAEVFAFLAAVALLVACMAALGLLASVAASRSNVSLLICLCFWLGAVVITPNTITFWTSRLFPLESEESYQSKVSSAEKELNDNAPEGSWAASGDDPFFPQHKLRADLQMKLMLSEKSFKDVRINEMSRQYERARALNSISPVSLFSYLCEAVVGGGYGRLQKAWVDIHTFQNTLLTWFKDIDAKDPASPHWYNPYEGVSTTRKGVSWETVPQFREQKSSFGERLAAAELSLVLLVIYTVLAFALSFVLFLKYDVR
jgi:ABC-type transport system involved in multi-copper enzyme maturation permease subunit